MTTESLKSADQFLQTHNEFRGAFQVNTNEIYSEIGKVEKTKLQGVLLKKIVSL